MKIKRKIISLIIIIFSIMLCIFGCQKKESDQRDTEDVTEEGKIWGVDSYDSYVKRINETYDTDIVIYGEALPFKENLEYRKIDEISDDNLKEDHAYEYIIINDLNDTLNLSKKDIEVLKKHVIDGKTNLIYLGEEQYDTLRKHGFYEKEKKDGDLGFAYLHMHSEVFQKEALWSRDDKRLSGKYWENNLCVNVLQFIDFVLYEP